jgi:predicted DNA-binding transcriptional regulator AlpA
VDGTLTRKQAVQFLGMSDTEFALRLLWDSKFPKPVEPGLYRSADIVEWMDAHKAQPPATPDVPVGEGASDGAATPRKATKPLAN